MSSDSKLIELGWEKVISRYRGEVITVVSITGIQESFMFPYVNFYNLFPLKGLIPVQKIYESIGQSKTLVNLSLASRYGHKIKQLPHIMRCTSILSASYLLHINFQYQLPPLSTTIWRHRLSLNFFKHEKKTLKKEREVEKALIVGDEK